MPERCDPRVSMGQDKDGFGFGMAAESGNDELSLPATSRRLDRSQGHLKQINVIFHPSTIFEWC